MIVAKQVFEMPEFMTRSGAVIVKPRVGWESYGTLSRDRSNAILVTHYFSATSHAAGKYLPEDENAGYWDAIIGPGKPIDTDRFFVVSSDTLVNLNARDPKVTTTGPASRNPTTGDRYGLEFPVVSIHDFVALQKALVESLGIRRLRAVIGPSMGALQAYQWAESFPEMVDRIVPVIGAAGGDPFLIAWLDVWSMPVRLDPKWRGGAYPEDDPPDAGLTAALQIVTLHAQQRDWAQSAFGKAAAEVGCEPAQSLANRFKIDKAVHEYAANSSCLGRCQQFSVPHSGKPACRRQRRKDKSADASDIFADRPRLSQPLIERTAADLREAGTSVRMESLQGPNGHLNGILRIEQAGAAIAEFIAGD